VRNEEDNGTVLNTKGVQLVSKLNEEACDDRPHPTPITRSLGELADTY